jgi:hypothetical protein
MQQDIMRRSARFLLVTLGLGLLPIAAGAGEGEPAGGTASGTALDPRLSVVCKPAGRRARPALTEFTQQVSAGILYQERVTPDQTRLELAWRPVGEARWTGKSLVPTDLEQCQPLLLEGDGVVAACRPQDDGRSATGRRLVRLGPGREPVRLANALPLPDGAHLHPLGEGRLLVWAEAAGRGPGEVGGDELIAAEVDATGRVLQQAIVSQPYVRKWPVGRGYLLRRQPPVGSNAPATYWRAEWDLAEHRLVFSPEQAPQPVGVCAGGARAGGGGVDPVPALVSVPGQSPSTGVAQLAAGPGGACLAGVTGALLPAGGRAALRAEDGRLSGRLWVVKNVSQAHPKGGKRQVPRITPLTVTCQVAAPRAR